MIVENLQQLYTDIFNDWIVAIEQAARLMYLEMMEQLTIRNQEDPWRVDRIVF
jgi:hypothetical protein